MVEKQIINSQWFAKQDILDLGRSERFQSLHDNRKGNNDLTISNENMSCLEIGLGGNKMKSNALNHLSFSQYCRL